MSCEHNQFKIMYDVLSSRSHPGAGGGKKGVGRGDLMHPDGSSNDFHIVQRSVTPVHLDLS